MSFQVSLEEGERQMLLLAMAKLSLSRPGWLDALEGTAAKMDRVVDGKPQMFWEFRRIHSGGPHPADLPSFVCPICGRESFNANDVAQGYCGACHGFTGKVSAVEIINVVGAQHSAIDMLMASLATVDRNFFPSKSGHIWVAVVAGNELLKKLRGEPIDR